MNDTKRKLTAIGSIVSLVLNIIVLGIFVCVVVFLQGTFQKMFNEMNVTPTGWTKYFLDIPKCMFFYPSVVLVALFLIIKEKQIKSDMIKLVINKLFLVFMVLVMIGYILSMLMPLYEAAGKL